MVVQLLSHHRHDALPRAARKQTSELGILANPQLLRNQPLSLCPANLNPAPESSEMVTGHAVALVGEDEASNPDKSRISLELP